MSLVKSEFHLPYNSNLKDRAKELRKNMTPEEKTVWFSVLKECGFRFNRQKIIDNFIVDFYCADLKLVIEIDGEAHYTEHGKAYDEERTQILESYGLTVLRFTNKEVRENIKEVKSKTFQKLEEVVARKMKTHLQEKSHKAKR